MLDDPVGYIAGSGVDNRIYLGALLELMLIVANIGTAVVLFPILRRQNESLAVGYVTARIMECVFIATGILAVLGVVTLRSDAEPMPQRSAGMPTRSLRSRTGRSCSAPASSSASGNGLILGYLMYRSEFVPRWLAMLGLIGGPLIILSGIGVLFDLFDAGGAVQAIATVPEFVWELSLGIYLTVKGFRTPEIAGHRVDPVSAATPA